MGAAKSTGNSGTQERAEKPRTTRGGRPLPPRSGRRPGQTSTKDQILVAALELFASKGYAGATIRAIADQAQVDPALIHHFFTNKEGVYSAAIESRLSAASIFDSLKEYSGPEDDARHNPVEWFARAYLGFWEDESTRLAMVAIYRTALTDEATSTVYQARVAASMMQIAEYLEMTEADAVSAITALTTAQLIGVAVVRYVAKVEPLASMDFDDLIDLMTPALEAVLDRRAGKE